MDRPGTRPDMRFAAALVFAATGAAWGAWAGRLPAIQSGLGLSAAQLSLVALAIEGGAIAGLPAGGALVTRAGVRRCLWVGMPAYVCAQALTPFASSLALLALAAAAMAAANSVIDVAANAAGVALERDGDRPVLTGLHAAHSLGVAAGGASAIAAAASGIGPRVHFAAVAVVAIAAAVPATRRLPPGAAPARRGVRPSRRLARVGALAFCALLVEGVAGNWSAVQLRTGLDAPAWLAAGAFTGFALMLALGRAAAGPLAVRVGAARLVRGAGVILALGAVLILVAPGPGLAMAGWACTGLAVSAVTPLAFAAAPGATTAPAPVAIATASSIGYLGSFTGPPAVGAIGLPAGLGLLVPAGLAIAGLSRVVRPSRPSPPPPRRARRAPPR